MIKAFLARLDNPATVQRLQMFNLLTLMAIGKLVLNLPITWFEIAIVVGVAIILDHLFIYIEKRKLSFFSYSAVNTALGVTFLLRTTDIWIYIFVVFVALLQKYVLRINGRHFLNPSNFAVVAGLAVFPYATFTTPDQWGGFWWLGVLMLALGLFITSIVNRALIPIVFMGVYTLLTYLFITHNFLEIFQTLISGSFLLFMLFMLTDPRTTPEKRSTQLLFTAIIALLTVFMELFVGVYEINMFLALFIMTLTVPWLRRVESGPNNQRTFSIVMAVQIVLVVAVYFSEYNYVRNLQFNQPQSVVQTARPEREAASSSMQPASVWENELTALYKQDWSDSHIEKVPYTPSNERASQFIESNESFQDFAPRYSGQEIGWEYLHHAPIATGDINHDGLLDIVMAKNGRGLKIYLATKDNKFNDATAQLFSGNMPQHVEYLALADLDNDSYLDLIVLNNQHADKVEKHLVYNFDPSLKQFKPGFEFYGYPKAVTGGIGLVDFNQDRILDIYIAYSRNWHDENRKLGFLRTDGISDQFWVSDTTANNWKETIKETIPEATEAYAGMTAVFSDIDQDGDADFMLANDMQPTLTLLNDNRGGFDLIEQDQLPYNSRSSMSYFSADFDNDGVFELWENCISNTKEFRKNRMKETIAQPAAYDDQISLEMALIRTGLRKGTLNCDTISTEYVKEICKARLMKHRGIKLSSAEACNAIKNYGERLACNNRLKEKNMKRPDPRKNKFDAERFPKPVNRNMALKRQVDGSYVEALRDKEAFFTGWSWAAYPYDVDNNGYQDLYITTGSEFNFQRVPNVMLMNRTSLRDNNIVRFTDEAESLGIDLLSDSRGALTADFDLDGDGDLLVNTVFEPSSYYQNLHGGDSIQVELRSKKSNYYALGSRLTLKTKNGVQVREIRSGGSWDSAQPYREHFGIPENDAIVELTVAWPDGHKQTVTDLEKNHLYVIYE